MIGDGNENSMPNFAIELIWIDTRHLSEALKTLCAEYMYGAVLLLDLFCMLSQLVYKCSLLIESFPE